MTTEKPELVQPSPKKPKFEQLRADHELFLRAFESKQSCDKFELYDLRSSLARLVSFASFEMLKRNIRIFVCFSCRTNANLPISSNQKCCTSECCLSFLHRRDTLHTSIISFKLQNSFLYFRFTFPFFES